MRVVEAYVCRLSCIMSKTPTHSILWQLIDHPSELKPFINTQVLKSRRNCVTHASLVFRWFGQQGRQRALDMSVRSMLSHNQACVDLALSQRESPDVALAIGHVMKADAEFLSFMVDLFLEENKGSCGQWCDFSSMMGQLSYKAVEDVTHIYNVPRTSTFTYYAKQDTYRQLKHSIKSRFLTALRRHPHLFHVTRHPAAGKSGKRWMARLRLDLTGIALLNAARQRSWGPLAASVRLPSVLYDVIVAYVGTLCLLSDDHEMEVLLRVEHSKEKIEPRASCET